ncbi:MAG: CDP-2,3-bis-(O-geranylgeranyl)-sn-glycerol synthase [Candidatus Aenigmatarchaeota archaeon]
MDLVILLVQSFWLIAPAYAANAFPPLMKGKRPIDFHKKFNGKRLLGDGKTIEGTLGGLIFGIFIGGLQIYFQQFIPNEINGYILNLTYMTPSIIILLSVGALIGDIFGSFIKRQIGIKRGDPAPLLDQLDFLIFALMFVSAVYIVDIIIILILLIFTPIIHIIANIIGYLAKIKEHPW